MPEGRDTDRYGNVRADRASPYFVAGTHGQDMPEPPADRSWSGDVAASEEEHRQSGEPLIRSTEGGGFQANTPAGIEAYRAATTRSALKIHVGGLKHSRINLVQRAAHQVLGLEPGTHKGRGANQALLDLMNTHMNEKYGT